MPKPRPYTQDELKGLRRADLQRLCKAHNIKGANAKSDVLVTILADYFTSSEYLSSLPKGDTSRSNLPSRQAGPQHGPANRSSSRAQAVAARRPPPIQAGPSAPPRVVRPVRPTSVTLVASNPARPERPRSHAPIANASSQRRAPSRVTKPNPVARQDTQPFQPDPQPTQRTQLIPQTAPPTALSNTNQRDPQLSTQPPSSTIPSSQTISELSGHTQIPPKVDSDAFASSSHELASLRAEVLHLRDIVAGFDEQSFLERLEKRMEDRIQAAVAEQLELVSRRESAVAAQEAALSATLARIESFQHKMFGGSIAHVDQTAELPPQEGALKRKEPVAVSDMAQPSQKRMRLPSGTQTPPPLSSAKVSEAPSTPDSSRHRVAPRTPPLQRGASIDHVATPGRDLSPRGLLPFPGAGASPSVDRSERLPFRPKHSRAKPSQAHLDLSAITESRLQVETESGPSCRPLLGSIAIDRSTVTPPALSPSPQIGGDNFTYTPLPPPFSRVAGSSSSGPSPYVARHTVPFDPQRMYMDIALNGFGDDLSPSAQATPSSRTMLGTERFRDNRFADQLMVSWPSPRLDYGPDTPSDPTTRHIE